MSRPTIGVKRPLASRGPPPASSVAGRCPKLIKTGNILTCPRCGGRQLHQENLQAHWRDDEDLGGVFVVSAKGGPGGPASASVERFENGDLCQATRRDCLVITFSCEDCVLNAEENGQHVSLATLSLSITQHKGTTVMQWD